MRKEENNQEKEDHSLFIFNGLTFIYLLSRNGCQNEGNPENRDADWFSKTSFSQRKQGSISQDFYWKTNKQKTITRKTLVTLTIEKILHAHKHTRYPVSFLKAGIVSSFLCFLNGWYMWYIYFIEFTPSWEEAIISTYWLAFRGRVQLPQHYNWVTVKNNVYLTYVLKWKAKAKENNDHPSCSILFF